MWVAVDGEMEKKLDKERQYWVRCRAQGNKVCADWGNMIELANCGEDDVWFDAAGPVPVVGPAGDE